MKSVQSNVLSIPKFIQEAVVHHQAGRLAQAEAIYQQVLQIEPNQPDALHLKGLIAHQVGNSELAVGLISKAVSIKPTSLMYSNLGLAFQALGKLDDAVENQQNALSIDPDCAEAYCNLGLAFHAKDKLDVAIASHQRALSIKSNYVEAHYNLGLAFHAQGKLDAAIESYQRALSIKPDYVEAHYNLGLAFHAQGKLDAAIEGYQQALLCNPGYTEANCNLGHAFRVQGKLDAAIESYKQALLCDPGNAEAHCNLGLLLNTQGRLDAAIECYQKAISINPNYIQALNGLALAYYSDGKIQESFEVSKRSLKIKETNESKALVVQCIQNIRFGHDNSDSDTRPLLIRAISEPWGRPSDLAASGISLIKLNNNIRECVKRATSAWPVMLSGEELFGLSGPALVVDSLFQCLLENAQICDPELERFLTMVRYTMLNATNTTEEVAASDAPEEEVLAVYCALARQCFINEYVFFCTDEELEKAELLREQLESAMVSGLQVPVLWPLTVASYFPLFSLSSCQALLAQSWPESVAALLVQQIQEPLEEQSYQADIPSLTPIEDEVSRKVRQQYEENPYPRWVKLPPGGKSMPIDDSLRQQFAYSSFHPIGKNENVDVLVAGCGTGQQSIQTAQRFYRAHVLAVDLSLASLGYAIRKTRELGVKNIEYAQADILELGSIGRMFDFIDSVGVLHHLADPLAGWRALLSLLRPNGFMCLGFYSELARQNVVAARNFIAEQGYDTTPMDIRRCRQDLLSMEENEQFKKLTTLGDFYGASECRDLLFHVQEHRFTLPQLKEVMEEFSLDFIGFFLRPNIIQQYSERFPDDRSKANLDYWYLFEAENPDTFTGMYQFMVQKRR